MLASRIAFLTDKGHTRTPTENEQLLAAIRVRIEQIEIARTNKNTTGLTPDQRAELAGINSTKGDLQSTFAERIDVLKKRSPRAAACPRYASALSKLNSWRLPKLIKIK